MSRKRYRFDVKKPDGEMIATVQGTHATSDGSGVTVYDEDHVVFVDPSRKHIVIRKEVAGE